jgi:hypothetical protein
MDAQPSNPTDHLLMHLIQHADEDAIHAPFLARLEPLARRRPPPPTLLVLDPLPPALELHVRLRGSVAPDEFAPEGPPLVGDGLGDRCEDGVARVQRRFSVRRSSRSGADD